MRKNITLKKFKHLRTKPDPLKKGVTYSFEKIDNSHNNIIAKKYVNGKLFKQKIITEKKMKSLVQKQIKKQKNKTMKKGGEIRQTQIAQPAPQQLQVETKDNTSMWTIFKQAFAFGIGIEVAEEVGDAIF